MDNIFLLSIVEHFPSIMDDPRPLKMCLLGDCKVGKSALLSAFVLNEYREVYSPTVFENYGITISTARKTFHLTLCDVPGDDLYSVIRPICFQQSACFLLCFSIDSHESYDNVLSKWYPMVKNASPAAAIILVGTKGDLYPKDAYNEAENIQEIISEADCNQLRDQIEAAVFVECSAKTNCNLKPIFKEAVKAVLLNEKRQRVKNNFLSRSQPSLFRFQ